MRSEIRFNGKLYNMIEDGAYKDDNGYYIVHAYDPMEQPDAYGWMKTPAVAGVFLLLLFRKQIPAAAFFRRN